jgi:hypothetical protein
VIAGGFVSATDPASQSNLFCDGEQWGFSNFLEIKLEVAPFAVGDGSLNAAVRFFEK